MIIFSLFDDTNVQKQIIYDYLELKWTKQNLENISPEKYKLQDQHYKIIEIICVYFYQYPSDFIFCCCHFVFVIHNRIYISEFLKLQLPCYFLSLLTSQVICYTLFFSFCLRFTAFLQIHIREKNNKRDHPLTLRFPINLIIIATIFEMCLTYGQSYQNMLD